MVRSLADRTFQLRLDLVGEAAAASVALAHVRNLEGPEAVPNKECVWEFYIR